MIQLEVAGRTDIPVAEGSHVTITVCNSALLLILACLAVTYSKLFSYFLSL